ncbi:EAL domain-containing protein, partial [Streptomyces niveiscabiei]
IMPLPTPLYDTDGKLTGAINLLVDVTSGLQPGPNAVSGRHDLAEDLEAAIAQKQLYLHYQPVFSVAGVLTGFEALARWVHPARGVVAPSEFIPAA